MSAILYGLKNCDTCRKALKTLKTQGVEIEFVDIRDDADLLAKVPEWLSASDVKTLLNTRSKTWRALSDEDKARAETNDDLVGLLADHPTLIKRPVIESEAQVYIGWNKETELALAKSDFT